MATQSAGPRDLFLCELGRMYHQLSSDFTEPSGASDLLQWAAFDLLLRNLHRCAEALGGSLVGVRSHTIEGFMRDWQEPMHQSSLPPREVNVQALGDLGKFWILIRYLHLHISAYRSLIVLARTLDAQECVGLLEQNLRELERIAQQVEQHGPGA